MPKEQFVSCTMEFMFGIKNVVAAVFVLNSTPVALRTASAQGCFIMRQTVPSRLVNQEYVNFRTFNL